MIDATRRSAPDVRQSLVWLKAFLLAVALAAANPGSPERVRIIGAHAGLLVYAMFWVLCLVAVYGVAFRGGPITRAFWSLTWAASAVFGVSFWLITRKFMQLADVETLINAAGFADNLSGTYDREILWSCAIGMLGLIAVNLPPNRAAKRRPAPRSRWVAALPLLPIVPMIAMLYLRGGEGTNGMPVQFSVPAFLLTIAGMRVTEAAPPQRSTVVMPPTRARAARTIVVIMDESLRGDLLDINAGPAYSGLHKYADVAVNFGVMSSMANCSDTTNVSFRHGATRATYLTDIKANPSIWAYAAKAGFRTYYLDAQRHSGKLQNLMTADERGLVDDFVQVDPRFKPSEKDLELARRLRAIIIADDTPKFIYVNKMGMHFPYEGKYPPQAARFTPTSAQSYYGTEADPSGVPHPDDESGDARARFLNSYLNAVSWNVGGFFDVLLPDLDLADVAVVYMADHGQDLHEDGRPGYGTHCSNGWSAPGEGRVPLILMAGNPALLQALRADAGRNFGKVSQFNVFPTVLGMLGYDLQELGRAVTLEKDIGQPLDAHDQQFLSTYFVRFGRKPVWNDIH